MRKRTTKDEILDCLQDFANGLLPERPPELRYLTSDQIAQYCTVSVSTVRKHLAELRNEIPKRLNSVTSSKRSGVFLYWPKGPKRGQVSLSRQGGPSLRVVASKLATLAGVTEAEALAQLRASLRDMASKPDIPEIEEVLDRALQGDPEQSHYRYPDWLAKITGEITKPPQIESPDSRGTGDPVLQSTPSPEPKKLRGETNPVDEVFKRIRKNKSSLLCQGKGNTIRQGNKQPRRNDPCPCESGKKWKRCCIHKFNKLSTENRTYFQIA